MTDGSVLWFGLLFGLWLWFLRKIRLTQLWVELSWVVATSGSAIYVPTMPGLAA